MDPVFKQTIEQGLIGMKRKDIVLFAWRCAVRALPRFPVAGTFSFIPSAQRQQYIYQVIRAIDTAAIPSNAFDLPAGTTSQIAAFCFSNGNVNSGNAVAASSWAASSSGSNGTDNEMANDSACVAAYADASYGGTIQSELAQDYVDIDNKIINPIVRDSLEWSNLSIALANEGCSYWTNIIDGWFTNGEETNTGDLLIRLNVPQAIQDQGAAAVAAYLSS